MPEQIIITEKLCRKCSTVKPLADFYNCQNNNKLGVTSQCKICVDVRNKKNTKIWRNKDPEATKARNREYYLRKKNEKESAQTAPQEVAKTETP